MGVHAEDMLDHQVFAAIDKPAKRKRSTCKVCAERERQKAKWGVYPCEQCAEKNTEIAKLTALVSVGREMANAVVELCRVKNEDYEMTHEDAYHFAYKCYVPWNALYDTVEKWRSLEG